MSGKGIESAEDRPERSNCIGRGSHGRWVGRGGEGVCERFPLFSYTWSRGVVGIVLAGAFFKAKCGAKSLHLLFKNRRSLQVPFPPEFSRSVPSLTWKYRRTSQKMYKGP